MKFWPKKRKKEARVFYDIIPPEIIKRAVFLRKKTAIWLQAFRLFLKTSKYGSLAILAIIVFGGLIAWATMPKEENQIIQIYATKAGGDIAGVSESGEFGSPLARVEAGSPLARVEAGSPLARVEAGSPLAQVEAGWKNAEKVLGAPEAAEDGDLDSFSENNSAVYKSGPASLIISGFEKNKDGTDSENNFKNEFKSAKIKFSFAMGEKKADLEIQGSGKLPIEDSAEPSNSPDFFVAPFIQESGSPAGDPLSSESVPILTPAEAEPPIVVPKENALQEVLPPETGSPVQEGGPVSLKSSLENLIGDFFGVFSARAQEGEAKPEEAQAENNFGLPLEPVLPDKNEVISDEVPVSDGNNLSDKNEIISASEPVQEEYTPAPLQEGNISGTGPKISGDSLPDIDAKIIVSYSFDGEIWYQLDTISGYSLSNALNGGYFTYDLPLLKNWDDLKNLKIKFEGVVGGETQVVSYLDSVWLKVSYKETRETDAKEEREIDAKPEIDAEIKSLSSKKDFKRGEEPELKFHYEKKQGIIAALGEALGINGSEQKIKATGKIINPGGESEDVLPEEIIEANGDISVKLKKDRAFRPGLYKVILAVQEIDADGNVVAEETTMEQNFTWGVLTINVNKSIYINSKSSAFAEAMADKQNTNIENGEIAYIQMGVLNDNGHTVCDASLKIEIRNPKSPPRLGLVEAGETKILSTEDGTIERSGKCRGDNVTDAPDYFAHYQVGGIGTYQMILTRIDPITNEKISEIADSFEVRDSVPFEVERIGPTRILPTAPYEMILKIKANQDFSGEIVETVPEGFVVSEISNNGVIAIRQPAEKQSQEDGIAASPLAPRNDKIITWQVDLKAGDEIEIKYTFDAPDISPYIYLLGPLGFYDNPSNSSGRPYFSEIRSWQIASDAVVLVVFLTTTGTQSWTVPDDWTDAGSVIEVIGGGGGGGTRATRAGGGGGGAYSKSINIDLTGGNTVSYAVGTGGTAGVAGGDSWFNAATLADCVTATNTVCAGAKGGSLGPTAGTGGAGGVDTSGVGTTRSSGGTGGAATANAANGGGGGSAGAGGIGKVGGTGNDTSGDSGGGGGGSGGTNSSTGSTVGAPGGSTGGNGGDGPDATGKGTGGNGSDNATIGTLGGGGGGGDTGFPGKAGGGHAKWTQTSNGATAGSGGGGGGGGNGGIGGDGGLYGGGGGGGSTGGTGKQGIVVVTYTAAAGCYAKVTGNWNTGSNWTGCTGSGGIPAAADDVIISTGITITLDVATPTVNSLTIKGTLNTSGTNYAVNTKNLTIGAAGTLTANGSVITLSGTSGTLFTKTGGGTFTIGTSEVAVISASGPVTLLSAATTFNALTINAGSSVVVNAGAVITMSSTNQSNDRLYIQSGILDDGGNSIVGSANGTMVMDSTGTLKIGLAGTASAFPSNYTNGIITLNSASTVVYQSGIAQTVSGVPAYGNLTITPLSGTPTMTLGAATAVNGTLTISTGGTLELSTLGFTANGATSITGTLSDNSATGTNLFAGLITINGGGTWTANGVASAFEIRGGITNGGTFTSGTGTYTFTTGNQDIGSGNAMAFGGAVTVTGITVTNNNAAVSIAGNFTGTGSWTQGASSGLSVSGATTNAIGIAGTFNASTNDNTVTYALASGGQTIKTTTYRTLTLSNTSGTQTAGGDITATTLNISNANAILDMATYALTVTTPNNSGTIKTQNTSAAPVTANKTWGGTVEYNAASGSQKIMDGTYGVLTLSNTSGTDTANNNITATTLNISNANAILDMATYTLTVTTPNNSGTIKTQSTSATPLSAGKNWGGTVEYNGSGSQTVVDGTYNNLTHSGSGTGTLGGVASVGGDLNISGGVLYLSSYTANRSSAGGILTVANGATLKIGGTGTLPSNYDTHSIGATSTVEYAGTATSVAALNSSQVYGNLTISGSAVTTSANFSVAATLSVTGSLVASAGTATMSAAGSTISNSGVLTFFGLTIAANPTSQTQYNTSFNVGGALTVDNGITFAPTGGVITMKTGGSIVNNGGAAGNLVFQGLTIDSGASVSTASSFHVKGNWTSSGSFTASAGVITFNSASAQSIGGDNTWYGLAVTASAARAVSFQSTKTQTIAANGSLTFTGAAGELLTLAPITPTVNWKLSINNTNVTQSVSNVSVSYSDASGTGGANTAVNATDITNSGTFTTNWNFAILVTVSGASDMRTGSTVRVAVNGTLDATHTSTINGGTGAWSISNVPITSGQSVIVFVEDATASNESTDIAVYDGSGDMDGMVLNANVLSIGSNNSNAVALSDADDYVNGTNGYVMHSVASPVLTVDGGSSYSAEKINILSGNTLNISGTETLTTYDITITGTLTSVGNSTYNVAHDWTNNGTFTKDTSTVTFNAASGTQTITTGGTGAGKDFNNVTLSNNTFSIANDTKVGGNLVISEAKAPAITAASNQTFTVTGTTAGTTGSSAETLTVNTTGAVTFTGAVGSGDSTGLTALTITNSAALLFSSTVNITGALTQTNAATGATTFSNTVAAGSATLKGTTFDVNNSFTAAAAGAVAVTNSGLFTKNATGAIVAPGGFSTSGDTTLGNNITTTNTTLSVGGALIISDGATVVLSTQGGAGAGNITLSSTVNGVSGGSADNLTLIAGTGTVSVVGIVGASAALGTITLTSSGGTTFSSTVSAATVTLSDGGVGTTVAFQGTTTATTGMSAAAGTAAYNVSFTGASNSIAGATTFSNTGSVTFGNTSTFTSGVTHTAGSNTISNNITATNSAINLNSATAVNGSAILSSGTGQITLGAATLSDGVTLTLGAGAATPISTSSITGTASGTASNLTINTTGAVTIAGAVGTDIGTLTVTNSGGTTFSSTVSAATLAITDTTDAATVALQGNTTFTTAMTVAANGAYNVSLTGSSNTIAGATTFNNTGTVTLGNGSDTIAFTGGVVATAPSSVTVNGTVQASGTGVITLGDADTGVLATGTSTIGGASTGQITLGAATLSDGVTLTLGAGAATPITTAAITGTASGSVSNLTINTTGAATIGGAVGTDIGVLTKQGSGDLKFGSSTLASTGLTLSAGTINTLGTDSGAWTISDNVTISAGTLTSTTNTLTIGGNYSNSGIFTHNSGTVTMNAGDTTNTLSSSGSGTMTGSNSFYNLTFNNSNGAWSFSNDATVANDFIITASETATSDGVKAPSGTLIIGGNFTNTAGKFTHSSGTVNINSANGWNFKKAITLNNQVASTLTNYQVKVIVHTGAGTDSGDDVYCGTNNCRTDFGDIRFTDASGVPIDYWMEGSTSPATFWVEVPSIPSSGKAVIYMLYEGSGSSKATTMSGANTFEFFDDFSGTSLDSSKWTDGGGNVESGGLLTSTGVNGYRGVKGKTSFDTSLYMIRSRASLESGGSSGTEQSLGWARLAGEKHAAWVVSFNTANEYSVLSYDTGYNNSNKGTSYTGYHIWEVGGRISSTSMKYILDNGSLSTTLTTQIPTDVLYPTILAWANGKKIYTDWILVRKYSATEPTKTYGAQTSTGGTITPNGSPFNNLTFNGLAATFASNPATVAGNFTITTGTVTAPSAAADASGGLKIAGNYANNGGTFTHNSGTVTFDGSTQSIGGTTGSTFNNVITSGTTNTSTAFATIIAGTLVINDATTFTAAGYDLTITGATTVGGGSSGTLTITNTNGAKTFGDVTIAANGTWNEAVNEIVTFNGSLTHNGATFTAGTAEHIFAGASKTIGGSSAIAIPYLTISGTTQNNGTLTVSTTLAGASTLTNGANATLNIGASSVTPTLTASASPNTVNYNGTTQTVKPTTYHHLTLSGSNAKTMTSVTTVNGNFTMSGSASTTGMEVTTIGGNVDLSDTSQATTGANLAVTGTTAIHSGTTLTIGAFTLANTGTTTVDAGGSLIFSSATNPGKTFTGDVLVNGVWNEQAAITPSFAGNLTNNATAWTASTGTHTFTGTGKTISGTTITIIPDVSVSGTVTNSGTMTVSTTLSGAGGFTNGDGATGTLNFGGSSIGVATFTASAAGNTVAYNSASAGQTAFATTYNNLTINNSSSGVSSASNFTVNGVLTLSSDLTMTSSAVLTMEESATTVNTGVDSGDVVGIVYRTGLVHSTSYTFGNQYTTFIFSSAGSVPDNFSVKMVKNDTGFHGKSDVVDRFYDIIRTGGSSTRVTMNLHYADSELNGLTETNLAVWDWHSSGGIVEQHGVSDSSDTNNYVEYATIGIGYIPTAYDSHQFTLAENSSPGCRWNGVISTSWSDQDNWSCNRVPETTDDVYIPNAGTTNNDPTLIAGALAQTLKIEASGVLNGGTGNLTISGGSGAWNNSSGTFNRDTSAISFSNSGSGAAIATIAGTTDFYDLAINSGAGLRMLENSITRIARTVTNSGTWYADENINTVEYIRADGSSQTVLNPNDTTPGYYNLILSGSGTKTMPGTALVIDGDFTTSGTASATAAAALTIGGNVTLGSGTAFNASTYTHSVKGNWTNNTGATFTAGTSTITFNASSGNKTINDGGDHFNNIVFDGTAASWTYTDEGTPVDGITNSTELTSNVTGVVNFINARTGSLTVSGGTLNVDWYLGAHVVNRAATGTNIDTGSADITISENSGSPAPTVFRYNGSAWSSGSASQTTGTDSNGLNPQPNSDGAIRIREYSMTDSATCPGAGCALYDYNLEIAWQTNYGAYDYYDDYAGAYLTSSLNSGTIGSGWHRSTPTTANADGFLNSTTSTGTWYVGMLSGLNVTITGNPISFGDLNPSNNFTSTATDTTNISVTSSANSGYTITAWQQGPAGGGGLMACEDTGACGNAAIPNFTYGSYATPVLWSSNCVDNINYCGFGFTSSDTLVESVNRYAGATKYTYFPTSSASAVRVADYPDPSNATAFDIKYKLSVPITQRAGPYSTTIIYAVTAEYGGGSPDFACGTDDVVDIDNNSYNTVQIGSQCWMAQNLAVTKNPAGAAITRYCYNDTESNCGYTPASNIDGGLYTWNTMMNGSASCNGTGASQPACATLVQGICPSGWHVPSHYEFTLLEKNVGSNPDAFPYDETTIDILGTDEGTNLIYSGSSGFSGVLTGYGMPDNTYDLQGNSANFWSSTDNNDTYAWFRALYLSNPKVDRFLDDKIFSVSVRCVKN